MDPTGMAMARACRRRRLALPITVEELVALTVLVDPRGLGVVRQTIYRFEKEDYSRAPQANTWRLVDRALHLAERRKEAAFEAIEEIGSMSAV